MKLRISLTLFVLISCFGLRSMLYAQEIQRGTGISAECGNIIEDEFTSNYQEITYSINLKAGDSIDVSLVPLGAQLTTSIFVTGPTNIGVGVSNGTFILAASQFYQPIPEEKPTLKSGILSASGIYTIRIINFRFYQYITTRDIYEGPDNSVGIGVYTLYIGCTLRDGTVINPGDNAPAPKPPTSTGSSVSFSGTGFAGLEPVDFANAFTNELTLGQPAKSKIPVSGDAVLGYTFDAAANDNLALNFTRLSGNLNLGLVVLSADNKVVFQASLVTSSELTTKFTLPSAGTYTIGIFRIDLLPPDAPEATAFQLTATLNP